MEFGNSRNLHEYSENVNNKYICFYLNVAFGFIYVGCHMIFKECYMLRKLLAILLFWNPKGLILSLNNQVYVKLRSMESDGLCVSLNTLSIILLFLKKDGEVGST